MSFFEKVKVFFSPFRNLVWISLAAWVTHIILRVLLLFRNNPYGFPFVSKPDWYIFHAVCLDFLWICNALVAFALVAGLVKFAKDRKHGNLCTGKRNSKIAGVTAVIYAVFHSLVLLFTLLDQEVLRFLGSHLSFGLMDTYKDTSSVLMFWDYVANDLSVPYLQFIVLVLMLPFTYGIYRLLKPRQVSMAKVSLGMAIFYVMSFAFVYFIWTGNARMTKLRPLVSIICNELASSSNSGKLDEKSLVAYTASYQKMWLENEGDSLWSFAQGDKATTPLYRIPSEALVNDSAMQERRAQKPNFIVIFMESHRGLNTGFLNPSEPSPTPYYDSLAAYSRIWERMHTSGLPTTGGVLSTHMGIPHHSTLAEATDLAHVSIPSFASYLTAAEYSTHYFSAADPAWDNIGVWMSKWYNAQHYNREREDDSTFFDHAATFVVDTLGKQGKPFLATLMTRSNHYPFNFAAGMTDEEKNLPLTERVKVTMKYADRQLARFMRTVEKAEWYNNTYVIIMADHGFPLGENGVSTMNGGAFSNATWIPFLIHGNGIEPSRDTATTAQLDIAPTILHLAGIVEPNMFMGHDLLRGTGKGLSLGAYSGHAAIGYDGYRLIQRLPTQSGDVTGLFAEGDTHQTSDLTEKMPEQKQKLEAFLDTLIKISDYSLERGM